MQFLFFKKIREKFGLRLPMSWRHIIQSNAQLFALETSPTKKTIVYPKRPELSKYQYHSAGMKQLILPWEKKEWKIYIIGVISTNEVLGALLEPGYLVSTQNT